MAAVVGGEAGAGQIGFDAAGAPAVAGGQRQIVGLRQRQGIVPPLAGDPVGAGQRLPAQDDAAADAGAENDAENDFGALPGAVDRFREREAVGVVGQAHFALQQRLQVAAQRLAVQAGRVGVLDAAVQRRFGARRADADAAAPSEFAFRRFDEAGDRVQRRQIVALRRRHAPAQEFAAGAAFGLFERDDLDLRAAEIDAEAQHGAAAQAAAGTKGAPGVKVSSSASAAA